MPACIVTGCNSGYGSNREKRHFFTIPRDPQAVILWKDAVKRSDSSVKAGSSVCDKHFRKDEILWQRHLLGPNGEVVGVGQYKVPRLKKGSVPSQFSWTTPEEIPKPQSCHTDNPATLLPSAVIKKSNIGSPIKFDVLSTSQQHKTSSDQASISGVKVVPKTEIIITENGHVIKIEPNAIPGEGINGSSEIVSTVRDNLRFEELWTAEVHLPLGWRKYITGCEGKKLIFFYTNQTVKIGNNYHMFQSKNLVVQEDMAIQVKIVGFPLDLSDFQMPSFINDMEQLQELLTRIHRSTVCRGAALSSVKYDMEVNNASLRKDIGETWRHNECPLLLVNEKICASCRVKRNSLSRLNRRHTKQDTIKDRKKTVSIEEERKKLVSLQARYRSAIRVKRLAREKIKTMQSEVTEMRRKIACYSSRDLEQHVNSRNISRNQLCVLNEIIEAAQHKNARGRNYSEEWILLCVRLYMRSSSDYEFLRSNEILPLPCIKTVRRYLSKMF